MRTPTEEYKIINGIDVNDIIDGRSLIYLSKRINYNRENLSKILNGKRTCSFERAESIIKYCRPDKLVTDYFRQVDKKEG